MQTPSETTRLLDTCITQSGETYIHARYALLSRDLVDVTEAISTSSVLGDTYERPVVVNALRARASHSARCDAFGDLLERIIDKSRTMAIVANTPVAGAITDFCVKEAERNTLFETLALERLLKYEDPPHVKEGIIIALGTKGSVQSLSALRGLMSSTDEMAVRYHCVRAVGKLSRKFSDATAVPDLVRLYRTIERPSTEDVPKELKGKVPPPFQRQVVSALRQIESVEALEALDDLQRTETDHVLISIIEDARDAVRARMKAQKD